MTVTHTTRPASIDEIAAEMDRRGAVIEKLEASQSDLIAAGKHLAVKLSQVYHAAGQKPANCQAIRDWMAALAKAEGRP